MTWRTGRGPVLAPSRVVAVVAADGDETELLSGAVLMCDQATQ